MEKRPLEPARTTLPNIHKLCVKLSPPTAREERVPRDFRSIDEEVYSLMSRQGLRRIDILIRSVSTKMAATEAAPIFSFAALSASFSPYSL